MALKSKINISLTDLVDFVCKSGSAKLTKVKSIKTRDEYTPSTDFYKPLREGIVENHQKGGDKKDLNDIIYNLTDIKKRNNYTIAVDGYKKFWGRKKIVFFQPPTKKWVLGDLCVTINPELGLKYDSEKFVIKLYLKSDKLGKDKIDQILTLLEHQLREKLDNESKVAILDVKNSKLFVKNDRDMTLLPLLEGEAKSFETIWNGIL